MLENCRITAIIYAKYSAFRIVWGCKNNINVNANNMKEIDNFTTYVWGTLDVRDTADDIMSNFRENFYLDVALRGTLYITDEM